MYGWRYILLYRRYSNKFNNFTFIYNDKSSFFMVESHISSISISHISLFPSPGPNEAWPWASASVSTPELWFLEPGWIDNCWVNSIWKPEKTWNPHWYIYIYIYLHIIYIVLFRVRHSASSVFMCFCLTYFLKGDLRWIWEHCGNLSERFLEFGPVLNCPDFLT